MHTGVRFSYGYEGEGRGERRAGCMQHGPSEGRPRVWRTRQTGQPNFVAACRHTRFDVRHISHAADVASTVRQAVWCASNVSAPTWPCSTSPGVHLRAGVDYSTLLEGHTISHDSVLEDGITLLSNPDRVDSQ